MAVLCECDGTHGMVPFATVVGATVQCVLCHMWLHECLTESTQSRHSDESYHFRCTDQPDRRCPKQGADGEYTYPSSTESDDDQDQPLSQTQSKQHSPNHPTVHHTPHTHHTHTHTHTHIL
jgi:hypothetical protein